MTYPWETQPFTDDFEFELEDAEDSLEEEHHHHAAGPPSWMRTVVPLLTRHAGAIPLPVLVGWVQKESGGRIDSKTSLREYGYFQLMPSESELLKIDHERLRTDADYSVRAGIKLVHFYAKVVMTKLGVDPSAPSFWALVKFHHAIGIGDARKLLRDAAAHGVDLRSWPAVKAHAEANRAALLAKMKHDPRRFLANVDGTLAEGARLWALWQAAPAPASVQPQAQTPQAASCNCAHEVDELEWEDEDASATVSWDRQGEAYVAWLQAGLNRALKLKPPLPVDGKANRALIGALSRLQHSSTSKLVRIGLVGEWTNRLLTKAGAPPPPSPVPPVSVGFDCNWDTRKVKRCLKRATYQDMPLSFVMRYYTYRSKHSTSTKVLTRGEADFLAAQGLRCAVVWEFRAGDANGYANGLDHGRTACKRAVECGQPSGTPIYFAVDYAPTEAQKPGVARYFEGVRDGLAAGAANRKINPEGRTYQIGVYGNRPSLDLCKAQGIATWFWQSCSPLNPDGTNQFRWPGVNLHQVKCEKPLCAKGCGTEACGSAKVDWNESGGNEGSWFPTAAATATTGAAAAQHELGFRERRRQRLWGTPLGESEEFFD